MGRDIPIYTAGLYQQLHQFLSMGGENATVSLGTVHANDLIILSKVHNPSTNAAGIPT